MYGHRSCGREVDAWRERVEEKAERWVGSEGRELPWLIINALQLVTDIRVRLYYVVSQHKFSIWD